MGEKYKVTEEDKQGKVVLSRKPPKVEKNKLIFNNIYFSSATEIELLNDKINIYKESKSIIEDIREVEFNNCIMNAITLDKSSNIVKLTIKKSIIIDRLTIEDKDLVELDLTDSIFHSKVKIQKCIISEKAIFLNTAFKDLADFYQTEFNEVIFKRTDFEKISVFSEAKFNSNVDFKYTKFLGKSIFRDTVIKGKLDLRNSIFDDEANFLDITSMERKKDDETEEFYGEPKIISVANRETARIIKNFYDKSNNIIEANKFYKKEMQQQQKELNFLDNPFNYLVFTLHDITSDHSQNWVLALVWIFVLAVLYTCPNINHTVIFLSTLGFVLIVSKLDEQPIVHVMSFLLWLLIIQYYFTSGCNISSGEFCKILANNLNPIKFKDDLTLLDLGYKIVMGYLVYQFIVSVRQNTRRK